MPDYTGDVRNEEANQAYSSEWLNNTHLPRDKDITLVIKKVTTEEGDDRDKQTKKRMLALHFCGAKRALLLNKTNTNILGPLLGWEAGNWPGKAITLYVHQTGLGPGIAVKAERQLGGPRELPAGCN